MLGRELAVMLRSWLTWLAALVAALLIGHSFVLATDLYVSGSRSVASNVLMAREFDPLLGVVRPTLGGLYLVLSLLAPLLAARPLSVEKERRYLRVLVLQTGAPLRVLLAKYVAALAGLGLLFIAPLLTFALWRLSGGHLALVEVAVSLLGLALYAALLAAVALAAAALTETLAQATSLGLLLVVAFWAIDAAEGFAALAWLGRAADWSVTTHLLPFERGTLSLAACAWLLLFTLGALSLGWLGMRFDLPRASRMLAALALSLGCGLGLVGAAHLRGAVDCTEGARASLPAAVVSALRALPGPLSLQVYLDRDDSRRRQMESDLLARLRLARPDVVIAMPLDGREAPAEGARDEGYGRTVIQVAGREAETYSSSRTEIVTRILELAGRPMPINAASLYPGYPLVLAARPRRLILLVVYVLFPLLFAALGAVLTRSRRRFP